MINPFLDLAPIPLDGRPQPVFTEIVPLGTLAAEQVIRVSATGSGVESVLLLIPDELSDDAGVIVGGGRPDSPFDYRIRIGGPYFLFLQFDPRVPATQRQAVVGVQPGDADFHPPARQVVQVLFAPEYLSGPGLHDPTSMSDADQQFLAGISGQVADEIVTRLREIFQETPVVILTAADPLPDEPVSRLTFLPDRVPAEAQDVQDAALPPPDPTRPECQIRVIFGELLPRGTRQDPGNQVRNDEAVVYVGSFQGRGLTCQTAAINSLNNVILSLAQTGAHEIGHLIGLYHVEQVDVMNRSATLAFQRELPLQRGQIQVDRLIGNQVISEVFPPVIQDPAVYFRGNFGR